MVGIRVIRQILIALCIGCMATFWFMQKDERVQQYIGAKFRTTFEKAIGCTFEGKPTNVNFFSPSLTFSNVRVYSQDNPGWMWTAQQFTASCSWWHLIMYRAVDLRVTLEDLYMDSEIINGKPAVADHMKKLFMGLKVGLPIELKSVNFKHAACCLKDEEHKMQARFVWQNELKKMQGRMKTSGYLLDGSMKVGDRVMFESLRGSLHADIGKSQDDEDTTLSADCSVELPYLPKTMRQTFISGSWKGNHGAFSLKNVHEQVKIDPIQIFYDGTRARCSIRGSVPLASLWRFVQNDASKDELSGSCSLLCDMRYEDNECAVSGRISVDDCAYKNRGLGSGVLTYARQQGEWKGSVRASQKGIYGVKGAWQWQEATRTGSLKIANNDIIQLPEVSRMLIKPGALQCALTVDAAGHVAGSYKTALTSLWNDTLLQCEGMLAADQTQISSNGSIQGNPYECVFQLEPTLYLSSFHYDDKAGAPLIKMSADTVDQSMVHAVIGLPFIRTLSEQTYNKWPMHVEGSIAASIKKDVDGMHIAFTTVDGLIRLPQTYNVMRDGKCSMHINTNDRIITIQDLTLQFNEGTVAINRAVVHYDEHNTPIFMHVPILADSLMLNMEQGLFAKVSGYALLSKLNNKPTDVTANLIIDRAYMKENLLSGTFHKNLFRYTGGPFASYRGDTTCDIRVTSRVPVRVKTPFLETAVRVNLQVKNNFKDPQVTGSIDLLSGFLAFPYRPLYITKGTIYFLPNQLYDPAIELVAKNKIKKYNVELQVTGSLQNHQIALDAAPALTEEQIIALLLVGSEEESLNVVMPALIMKNLQTIMFGYDQSSRALDKIFSSLLQPFNRIHVVPSFNDKTGRGGLRGAIEIDVNDRWRALIQKNFSLTEDTRLEVEYLVSDEISVRGVANERRDVGAEVEMRWKF